MKGTITAFEAARGVGLIDPEDGGAHVGFRVEDVEVAKHVEIGEPVIYRMAVGDWYANRVRVLSAPRARRSRYVAAVLAILGGALGLHKFYLGYPWIGILILVATIMFWWLALIPVLAAGGLGVIEGIIYLSLSDDAFEERYLKRRRAWL